MGDRCTMHVECRRRDMHLFTAIGFSVEEERDGYVRLFDDDANYAHSRQLPTNVPFFAQHGPGDEYGEGFVACDGAELVGIVAVEAEPAVRWRDGKPCPDDVEAAERFERVEGRAHQQIKNLSPQPCLVIVRGGVVEDVRGVDGYEVLDWDALEDCSPGKIELSDAVQPMLTDAEKRRIEAHNAQHEAV